MYLACAESLRILTILERSGAMRWERRGQRDNLATHLGLEEGEKERRKEEVKVN